MAVQIIEVKWNNKNILASMNCHNKNKLGKDTKLENTKMFRSIIKEKSLEFFHLKTLVMS